MPNGLVLAEARLMYDHPVVAFGGWEDSVVVAQHVALEDNSKWDVGMDKWPPGSSWGLVALVEVGSTETEVDLVVEVQSVLEDLRQVEAVCIEVKHMKTAEADSTGKALGANASR